MDAANGTMERQDRCVGGDEDAEHVGDALGRDCVVQQREERERAQQARGRQQMARRQSPRPMAPRWRSEGRATYQSHRPP